MSTPATHTFCSNRYINDLDKSPAFPQMASESNPPSTNTTLTTADKMENSINKDASAPSDNREERLSGKTSLDQSISSSQNESTRGSIVPNQVAVESDLEKANGAAVPVKGGVNPADFPDGGLEAWLVVFGGWCCLFCKLIIRY